MRLPVFHLQKIKGRRVDDLSAPTFLLACVRGSAAVADRLVDRRIRSIVNTVKVLSDYRERFGSQCVQIFQIPRRN